jgi:geranylgeranyl reductase family protein
VIIGAGPAGAICALILARAGHQVLVLDKHEFPRHKICGDQLIPDSLKLLERVGILDRVTPRGVSQDRIRVFSPGRISFVVPGRFLGIRRHEFDHILMQSAVEAGASFAQGSVLDIVPSHTGEAQVIVENVASPLRARVVILATGASVHLADKLGLIERRRPSAVAMRAYYESDYPLEESILSYDRSLVPGYAWIFRVSDRVCNVGCGIRLGAEGGSPDDLRPRIAAFLREFPLARELVRRGRRVSEFRGAPLRCGLDGTRGFVRANVVCVGEVIGTTFPFTGEGIGKAMHSGLIAAEVVSRALQADDPGLLHEYADRIDTEIRPLYHGYRVAESWLGKPRLNDFVARRICRSRHMQEKLAEFAAESGDPRALFSWSSVARSFFK